MLGADVIARACGINAKMKHLVPNPKSFFGTNPMQPVQAEDEAPVAAHALAHPTQPDLVYHSDLRTYLHTYAERKEILHTLFYGPPGSGKMTLVRHLIASHMRVPLATVRRTQPHIYRIKDLEFPFYKTTVHFELNVADFSPLRQNALIELLQDLAKTLNVARNCYKLIVVRNVELLHRAVQHQLRRMMEIFYSTCRLLFVCHTLDCLDVTLQSRFVTMRVPKPHCLQEGTHEATTVSTWLSTKLQSHALPDIVEHIQDQLWTVLQRKTLPIVSLRKWIRITTMTHLPLVPILLHLYGRLVTRYPKQWALHQVIYTMTNACMHLYAIGYRKEFQPELLLCQLYRLIQAAKAHNKKTQGPKQALQLAHMLSSGYDVL